MKINPGFRGMFGLFTFFLFLLTAGNLARGQTAFTVSFYYPNNGQQFAAGANIPFYLRVADSNVVRTVQFFPGNTILGTVTNTHGVLLTNNVGATSVFSMVWSNVAAGN